MVIGGGAKNFKYTSLSDIEERYEEIGKQYPQNYGWYQCRWHAGAAGIYDAGGKKVLKELWDALKSKKEKLSDEALATFLQTSVGVTVADVMRKWDNEIIK